MGHTNAVKLLQATLEEEVATDKKITEAAATINYQVPIGHWPSGKRPATSGRATVPAGARPILPRTSAAAWER